VAVPYWVAAAVAVVAVIRAAGRRLGRARPPWLAAPALPAVLSVAAGAAVALISLCGAWLACRRLRPLWAALVEAVPEVRLPAGRPAVRTARWRLIRRVIEIRDAEHALRPFWREAVAARALAAARSAALSADLEQAVVEAAVVMDAARARLRGVPPPAGPPQAQWMDRGAGEDLHAEVARLVLVSRVIRRCPLLGGLAEAGPAAGLPGPGGHQPSGQARACRRGRPLGGPLQHE
jgi:hypothetical protein